MIILTADKTETGETGYLTRGQGEAFHGGDDETIIPGLVGPCQLLTSRCP